MTLARIALAVLLAATVSSCSRDEAVLPLPADASTSPNTGDETSEPTDDSKDGSGRKSKKGPRKGRPGKENPSEPPSGTAPSGEGDPTDPEGNSNGSDHATASARVFDSTGDMDASGDSPPYTDIIEARVQGRGRTLRMSITFRGIVPAKMGDDDTFMSVETAIDKGGRTYSVYADGDDEGWTAYLSQKGDSRRLEGAFSLDGSTTHLEIPWGLIGGPGSFRWTANSAWTRTTLTNTYFAFDSAPEGSKARYPK